MREGWTYKRLGEVCEVEYGTRVVKQRDGGNVFPVYGGGGATFKMDVYNRENRVVVSRFAMSSKCTRMVKGKFYLNDSGLTLKSNSNSLLQIYLDTCILALNDKIYTLGRGVAQKNLKVDDLLRLSIPIPTHERQQSIVAELDKINELIGLKKSQLSDLDRLAQSIFYEMFGDPVENEMGWEVSYLADMGELARGVSKHRPRNAPELLGGSMPLIQTGDVANADMYIRDFHSTYSDLGVSQSKIWKAGTLCVTIAATIGKCAILDFDACFPDSVVGFAVNKERCNNEYVYFIFKSLQSILEENAPAVAQKNINLKVLNNLEIPLPPLPLQQSFAARITAIEQQKQRISESIKDLETLLASRMQYWFDG